MSPTVGHPYSHFREETLAERTRLPSTLQVSFPDPACTRLVNLPVENINALIGTI